MEKTHAINVAIQATGRDEIEAFKLVALRHNKSFSELLRDALYTLYSAEIEEARRFLDAPLADESDLVATQADQPS